MRIALVYDYLTQFGGGERVLKALGEMFPEAPIFTLIYDGKGTGGAFKGREINVSFLQKIPGAKKFFRAFIWLMPLAVEQFNLSDFDLVISISHSFGKGIITKPSAKHICYCLTPTRYLWHDAGLPFKPISQFILAYLRIWDFEAAQRPDYFIASSENVRQRIKKYYNRESGVIYPPVETNKFYISGEFKNYFLMVGRMVPYKRFDIVVEAFSKIPQEKLVIIGDGPEYKKIKIKNQKLKNENVKFLGRVSDSELAKYYAGSKALIFPQEDDFGIVAVEAMASGRPLIAFRSGGALETVMEGRTGLFFDKQTADSLLEAVQKFNDKEFNPEKIRKRAQDFNQEIFKKKIREFINGLT
ncbi:MAG: glycosyltransferase [Patescibacteria group bacterium]